MMTLRRGWRSASPWRWRRSNHVLAVAAALKRGGIERFDARGLGSSSSRSFSWFSSTEDSRVEDEENLEPREFVGLHLSKIYFQKVGQSFSQLAYQREVLTTPTPTPVMLLQTLGSTLEQAYMYDKFHTPSWTEGDFNSKPIVLVLGQYSVGKTTFISHLLGKTYPGSHISPEPTTDRFVAICDGAKERVIPGNAAVMQEGKPFQTLKTYGSQLLNRFECVEVPDSKLLEDLILIDSPGVLSGEKQRIERGYDFSGLVRHWAERSERILLIFDAHKLDISDELKEAILSLKGNEDKIRCVLNKADRVGTQELMRVYGALLWSLGKVVFTPEVMRIFIGSFWDKPYQRTELADLFDAEKKSLMGDIKSLPQNSTIRKINEFAKRLRHVKVHSIVCDSLCNKFTILSMQSREQQQEALLRPEALRQTFSKLAKQHAIHIGDFPDPESFARSIEQLEVKLWEFSRLQTGYVEAMDKLLIDEMPCLFERLGNEATKDDV